MTTATLPRRFMRPVATGPARRSMLIGFVATFVAGIILIVAASAALTIVAGSTVLSGVSVGGVDVGGLSAAEAKARLEAELPSLSTGTAVVAVDDTEEAVSFADLGRRYELDAMVDRAMAIGRDGSVIEDGIRRLRSLVSHTALPVAVHAYDPEALTSISSAIASRVSHVPTEAVVTRDGTAFTVRPAEPGRGVEASDVQAALAAAIDNADPADVRVSLTPHFVPPLVDTATAEAAASAARGMAADLALTIPGASEGEALTLSADEVAAWISFGPQGEQIYAARLDTGAAIAAIAALADDVNQDPVSASFTVAGAGLGGIVPAVEGRELDVETSSAALLAALEERAGGGSVPSLALAVNVTQPTLTTAAAEEILPQMQMVSSWTTNYVPGEGNGFGANISIPALDLDGYNLAPGEWFSFWGGIGPISVDRGYQYGGAIINGRSVPQGALAGGICSTSTTLFNAAMRFGLEIGERTAHYYYIDRYPTGLDATVAIVDDSVTDMTFRNDTQHPIVIRGFGSPGQVTFQIWSVPNGRTVALSDPYITNRRAAIETTQVSSSLAPGTSKRVEYPHNGFDVTVSRTVRAADGTVLHENTWFSPYRPVNGITLVGPTAAAPPAEDDTETAAAGTGDAPPGG